MKRLLRHLHLKFLFVVLGLFWLQTGLVFAQQIRVVATFPDLADITRQIVKNWLAWTVWPRGLKIPMVFL
jgi:hypothetical protein